MYQVGSEQVTFSAQAPPEIAGTTATRWFVADAGGRPIISGLDSQADAIVALTRRVADEQLTAVTLSDGTVRYMTALTAKRFVGVDADGDLVVAQHGLVYALTPCCQASGTGTQSGVACRACYWPVSPKFGGAAVVAVPR